MSRRLRYEAIYRSAGGHVACAAYLRVYADLAA
jgi:hypothetical protein